MTIFKTVEQDMQKKKSHAQNHVNNESPHVSLENPKLKANARDFGQIVQDTLASSSKI